jgi:hypothetical protein
MRFTIALLTVGAVLTCSPAAVADPVHIVTSGHYLDAWDEDTDLQLVGSGFEVQAIAHPGDLLFRCHPCAAGTVYDLSTNFEGGFLALSTIFNGRSYPALWGFTGSMVFRAGSVLVPELPEPPPGEGFTQATLRAPFVASGLLTAFDNEALTGVPLFFGTFSGRGIATVVFINQGADFPIGVWAEHVRYDFEESSQTPEPVTLLLIGTGLTAGYGARWRRRQSSASAVC